MVRKQSILFLLFTTLSVYGIADTATTASANHYSVYPSVEKERQSSVSPEKRPQLFAIHRQGQSAVNQLRNIPSRKAKNKKQKETTTGLFAETSIRRAVNLSLIDSSQIDPGLTNRELLFPFHHFL